MIIVGTDEDFNFLADLFEHFFLRPRLAFVGFTAEIFRFAEYLSEGLQRGRMGHEGKRFGFGIEDIFQNGNVVKNFICLEALGNLKGVVSDFTIDEKLNGAEDFVQTDQAAAEPGIEPGQGTGDGPGGFFRYGLHAGNRRHDPQGPSPGPATVEAVKIPSDDFDEDGFGTADDGMLWIPGGTFRMGSTGGEPGRGPDELAAAEIAVPGPFFMSVHEVTHGQFQAVMGRSPAYYAPRMRNPAAVPVDSVTWEEAAEFCRKLTAKDRDRQSGWAYRLPTEAEWEYACRAGTDTPFWSGEMLVLGKHAVFDLEAELAAGGQFGEGDPAVEKIEKGFPHPVGTTAANPFGLFDTHGNVWEWCADPLNGGRRAARGGSWKEPAARCRSAARRLLSPTARERDVGFRVVFAPQ